MSRQLRPALAALLGAAVVASAAQADARSTPTDAGSVHASGEARPHDGATLATSSHASPESAALEHAGLRELAVSLDAASLSGETTTAGLAVLQGPALPTTPLGRTPGAPACDQLAAGEGEELDAPAQGSRLGDLIEARMRRAERAGRFDQVEELTTLWLTLHRRQQLDRVVRSERFVNAALRNQRYSALRSQHRRRTVESAAPAPTPMPSVDGGLVAAQLVSQLHEPYRTAVELSMQGMNRREVAEQMGVSHAAVRKWFQRLRDRLTEHGELALA